MIEPVVVEKFDRAESLISALRPLEPRWQPYPAEWVFRGQWDTCFRLLPTAYRAIAWAPFVVPGEKPFDPTAGYQSEIVQAQHEYRVLKRFHHGIDRAGLDVPNEVFVRARMENEEGNDLEFLLDPAISTFAALAQHHGVPTRLLDWSRAGLHAAYFAAADAAPHCAESGSFSVWALSIAFAEHARTIEERTQLLAHAPHLRIITAPRASNPNLHAQAGLFSLWLNAAKVAPLDDVVLQILGALEGSDDWRWRGTAPLRRFELPWSEAPKLLRLLSYEQVDAVRLFPGRDGVVRAMKERGLWDQKE